MRTWYARQNSGGAREVDSLRNKQLLIQVGRTGGGRRTTGLERGSETEARVNNRGGKDIDRVGEAGAKSRYSKIETRARQSETKTKV